MIEYQWLPASEWKTLIPLFDFLGWDHSLIPGPTTGRILIARDTDFNNNIVAFHITQLLPHAEPLWIDDSYRGKVSWTRMLDMSEEMLPKGRPLYVFAPTPHIERMCQLVGMEDTGYKVYRKIVQK